MTEVNIPENCLRQNGTEQIATGQVAALKIGPTTASAF
jgi:peptidyl-tRNA hydrolase